MKLDQVIAVSGLPGLYKLLASRANGLLIENFDSPKRQFVSARKHQFTPLVSIGIYTYSDVTALEEHRAVELVPAADGSGISGVLMIDIRTGVVVAKDGNAIGNDNYKAAGASEENAGSEALKLFAKGVSATFMAKIEEIFHIQ